MVTDLRHAIRSLRHAPASAAAAAGTLALVLGAGISLFALVDAVLLRPLPFTAPESLVYAGELPLEGTDASPRPVSFPTFDQWVAESRAIFSALEGFDVVNVTIGRADNAERVSSHRVTPGFFPCSGSLRRWVVCQ